MTSFKYAVNEILRTYVISILLIIQVAFCAVMIYKSTAINFYFNEKIRGMNYLEKGKDIYSVVLENGYEVYMVRGAKDTDKVINYMKSLKEVSLASIGIKQVYIKSFENSEKFKSKLDYKSNFLHSGYIATNSIAVGKTFLDTLDIRLSEGDSNDLFKNETGEIPVVLGNDYKKVYSIGSIIDGKISEEEKNEKYKVVGFLERGQYFTLNANNFNGNYIENMDTFFIVPASQYKESKDLSSYLIAFDKNSIDKEKIFNLIKNEGSKYDIQIDFADKSNEMKSYNKVIKNNINVSRLFLIITFIFVIVGTLVVSINKIALRKKEFGVHILSGARLEDIGRIVFIEFMIIGILSLLLSLGYLMYNSITVEIITVNFNWKYFGITSFVILILMSIISIFPIRKILNIDINSLVRGEE